MNQIKSIYMLFVIKYDLVKGIEHHNRKIIKLISSLLFSNPYRKLKEYFILLNFSTM
jgi:hypothetical protein